MHRPDTTEEVQTIYDQKIRELTDEDRFLRGLSLIRFSREMCLAGIRESHPDWGPQDLKVALFERIYGDQFSDEEKDRIRSGLTVKNLDI